MLPCETDCFLKKSYKNKLGGFMITTFSNLNSLGKIQYMAGADNTSMAGAGNTSIF